MAEKTSLEKSHSKSSNFKLTLLCIFASVFFFVFWVGAARVFSESVLNYVIMGVGAAGTILALVLFNAFKR